MATDHREHHHEAVARDFAGLSHKTKAQQEVETGSYPTGQGEKGRKGKGRARRRRQRVQRRRQGPQGLERHAVLPNVEQGQVRAAGMQVLA